MALKVEIVTPRGAALSAEADEATVPGVLGELGVLPGHRPLLSGVKPGVLRLRIHLRICWRVSSLHEVSNLVFRKCATRPSKASKKF